MRRLAWVLSAIATTLAVAATPASADPAISYYTLPATYGFGGGLDTTPDGIVYFGSAVTSADPEVSQRPPIGRLDPALAVPGTSNGMTFAVTPPYQTCCATQLRDMTWSTKDGTLYWTRSDGVVGRADGTVMQSVSTTSKIPPWGIAADPAGGAWLTEYGTGNSPNYDGARAAHLSAGVALDESLPNIAKQTGTFDTVRFDPKPKGIAVAGDGTVWFAESDPGNPGWRIGKVAAPYTEYPLPCAATSPCSGSFSGTGPSDVAVAADGTVWYTNELNHTIGHLIPGSTIKEYPLLNLAGGTPKAIRPAPDGSLWVAVYGGFLASSPNGLLRVIPSAGAADPQEVAYKTPGYLPLEVAPDTNGNVWFSGSPSSGSSGAIGRLGDVPPAPSPGGGNPGGGDTSGGGGIPAPGGGSTTPVTVAAVVTARATVTNPTVHGTSLTANQICVGPPQDRCSLVYLIQTHEYVTGFPGSGSGRAAVVAAAAKKKSKLVTIGKATVTLHGGQSKKVTVKLNAKGRRLLKRGKRLKSTLTVTQSVNGRKAKVLLKRSVTFKRK
jgi:streptogramin lyase